MMPSQQGEHGTSTVDPSIIAANNACDWHNALQGAH